jgi:hypothetical protein
MAELDALSDGFTAILKKSQETAEPAYQKMQAAEEEFAKTKGELGVKAAELKAKSARGSAGGQLAVYDKYEKELMAPPPTIQYSAETADGMKNLAMLLPIAGMMMGGAGQLSGVGALKAMSGVLEGHKQGNQDRIALEQKNFEQQMQNWKLHQEQIKGAFERALQRAKINASAAQSGLQVDLAKLDAQLLLADVKKNGIIDPLKRFNAMNEKVTTAIEGAVVKMYAEKPDNFLVNGQPRYILPSEAQAIEKANPGTVTKAGTSSGRTSQSVLLSGRAENIREAFAQVAKDMENIARFPPEKSILGTFAGMTGQSGTGLVSSLENTFARSVTDRDSRMLQQLISGLEANMSMALGSGYASSTAKGRIDMYKQQIPQSGDDGYAVANFLARIRQEMNVLADNFPSKPGVTEAMTQKVIEYNNIINRVIPFTVQDVLDASFADKEPPQPGQQPQPAAKNSYKSSEDVAAAFKAGKIDEATARKILKDDFGVE